MKNIIKDIMKSTLTSITIALMIFCIVGVIFDISYKGHFSLENYRFTKMIIGCILIGLGFGIPSIIYENEYLSKPIQVIIHMGIGLTVYTLVAIWVGWFSSSIPAGNGLMILLVQCIVAFGLWFYFYRKSSKEVKEMNERINAKKGSH